MGEVGPQGAHVQRDCAEQEGDTSVTAVEIYAVAVQV